MHERASAEPSAFIAPSIARCTIGAMRRPRPDDGSPALPLDLRSTRVVVGGTPLVVLSYVVPTDDAPLGGDALTAAEREVLALLLAGRRNAEIARARRTSLGTVSKQIDAVYRKLGVHSRTELAARLAR